MADCIVACFNMAISWSIWPRSPFEGVKDWASSVGIVDARFAFGHTSARDADRLERRFREAVFPHSHQALLATGTAPVLHVLVWTYDMGAVNFEENARTGPMFRQLRDDPALHGLVVFVPGLNSAATASLRSRGTQRELREAVVQALPQVPPHHVLFL